MYLHDQSKYENIDKSETSSNRYTMLKGNIYNLIKSNESVTGVIKKTKQLVKEQSEYSKFINSYNDLIIEPTFKLPELPTHPILKNIECISLSKIDFYKGYDYNQNILIKKKLNKHKSADLNDQNQLLQYSPFKNKRKILYNYNTKLKSSSVVAEHKFYSPLKKSKIHFSLKNKANSVIFSAFKINKHNSIETYNNFKSSVNSPTHEVDEKRNQKSKIKDHDLLEALNINKEAYVEYIDQGACNITKSLLLHSTEDDIIDKNSINLIQKLNEFNLSNKKKSSMILNNILNSSNSCYSSFIKKRFVNKDKSSIIGKLKNEPAINVKDSNMSVDKYKKLLNYIDEKVKYLSDNELENLTCVKEETIKINTNMRIKLESIKLSIKTYQFINDTKITKNNKINEKDKYFYNSQLPDDYKDLITYTSSNDIYLPFNLIPLIYCLTNDEFKFFISQIIDIENGISEEEETAVELNFFNIGNKKKEAQSQANSNNEPVDNNTNKKVKARLSAIRNSINFDDFPSNKLFSPEEVRLNLRNIKDYLKHDNTKLKLHNRLVELERNDSKSFFINEYRSPDKRKDLDLNSHESVIEKNDTIKFQNKIFNKDFKPFQVPTSNVLKISLISNNNLHEIDIIFPILQLFVDSQQGNKVFYKHFELEYCIDILMSNMENWADKCKIYLINLKGFRDNFRKIFSKEKDQKISVFNLENDNKDIQVNKHESQLHKSQSSAISISLINQYKSKSIIFPYKSNNVPKNLNTCLFKKGSNTNNRNSVLSNIQSDSFSDNEKINFELINLNKLVLVNNLENQDEFSFIFHKEKHFFYYCLSSYSVKYKSDDLESIIIFSLKHTQSLEKLKKFNLNNILYKLISVENISNSKIPKINTSHLDNVELLSKRIQSQQSPDKRKKSTYSYSLELFDPRLKYKFILKNNDDFIGKEEAGIIIPENLLKELTINNVNDWGFVIYHLYNYIELDNKAIVGNKMKFNFAAKIQNNRKKRIEKEEREKEEEAQKNKRVTLKASKSNIVNHLLSLRKSKISQSNVK